MNELRHKEKDNKNDYLIVHEQPLSIAADQYWQIFENIGLSMLDHDLKVLMVTSPGRGEGKSVTAANLAAIAAENGRRVLIIDADVRQPIQHKIFHLKNGSGWAAIIKNTEQLEEAVQPTMIANLSVLTSGRPLAFPARWLASEAVKNLVRKAAGLFDLVIIDAPDVLSGKEAPLLAGLADAILLIARAGKTGKSALVKAKSQFHQEQIDKLAVALNGVRPPSREKASPA